MTLKEVQNKFNCKEPEIIRFRLVATEWLTQRLQELKPEECLTSSGNYWKIEKTAKEFINELLEDVLC